MKCGINFHSWSSFNVSLCRSTKLIPQTATWTTFRTPIPVISQFDKTGFNPEKSEKSEKSPDSCWISTSTSILTRYLAFNGVLTSSLSQNGNPPVLKLFTAPFNSTGKKKDVKLMHKRFIQHNYQQTKTKMKFEEIQ